MKYLFLDLDGTLCESKQPVREELLNELNRLKNFYEIVIVSGAEKERIKQQAPIDVMIMSQNGNELYFRDECVWKNRFYNKESVLKHIEKLAKALKIKITPGHIDDRGSQISFSFIGHSASLMEKKAFDLDRTKRTFLLQKYPFKGAVIGGTTCIDYVPKTKGENIQKFNQMYNVLVSDCLYIGDAMKGFGNDATVIGVIPTWETKGEFDTLNFLKTL